MSFIECIHCSSFQSTAFFRVFIFQIVRQNFTLSGITKLTVALRFYAIGTFYIAIGDMFGISKSLVEVIICEVSFLIATKLRYRYIVLPETPQELLNAKVDFMRWSGFPLCIGAVDGTHVLIQSFGGRYAEIYRNRKMVFSLNCQVAVSADVNICLNFLLIISNIFCFLYTIRIES